MINSLKDLKVKLKQVADPKRAKVNAWFFKTGKGQYGEGDKFLGISNPKMRQIAKQFVSLSLKDINELLKSDFHEERQTALFILVLKYQKADDVLKSEIYKFYLDHTDRINNWDLVDCSVYKIVGHYLFDKDKTILLKLAKSKSLWERRISIITTYFFISKGQSKWTLKIAEILLKDKEDLIHKALGWMLREVGKRCSIAEEENFLKKYYKIMPRTMLRYAIEKFPESRRQAYLKGLV